VLAAGFWAVVLGAALVKRIDFQHFDRVATFGITFASIVIEALPFILIGSLVSAAMAVYVPDRFFSRMSKLPRAVQVPGAALAGFAFPVCECGSVPVGRRLVMNGITPAAALGFMFAAPVLNPVVLVSTWVAFGGGINGFEMTAGRAGLGFLVAMAAGLAVSRGGGNVLRNDAATAPGLHDHHHDHAHAPALEGAPWRIRFGDYLGHVATDLLFMARFLVLGAAVSALMQTFLPQQVIGTVAGTFLLGSLTLMGMAFILSLCSEADAFVAVSFTAFPRSSQLAFLVFGPILDTKLAALYGATFRSSFVPRLLLVTVPMILVGTAIFGLVT
jgi:uncharacterized membrane protein YraQ (UPF0718 family)